MKKEISLFKMIKEYTPKEQMTLQKNNSDKIINHYNKFSTLSYYSSNNDFYDKNASQKKRILPINMITNYYLQRPQSTLNEIENNKNNLIEMDKNNSNKNMMNVLNDFNENSNEKTINIKEDKNEFIQKKEINLNYDNKSFNNNISNNNNINSQIKTNNNNENIQLYYYPFTNNYYQNNYNNENYLNNFQEENNNYLEYDYIFQNNNNYNNNQKFSHIYDPQQDIYPNRFDNYFNYQKITPSMLDNILYESEIYIYKHYVHLININSRNSNIKIPENSKFYVIKSFNEEDIHKSIKYNVWSSSHNGDHILNNAYNKLQIDNQNLNKDEQKNLYLFFSSNGSGKYIGVARMISLVNFGESFPFWTQDNKWKGLFKVEWIFIKDTPFMLFRNIFIKMKTGDMLPVTYSRDIQEIPYEEGVLMIDIFNKFENKFSILNCFEFYDIRQLNYESNLKLKNNNAHNNRELINEKNSDNNKYTKMQLQIQQELFKKIIYIRNKIYEVKYQINNQKENQSNYFIKKKLMENHNKLINKENEENNYIKKKLMENHNKLIKKENETNDLIKKKLMENHDKFVKIENETKNFIKKKLMENHNKLINNENIKNDK